MDEFPRHWRELEPVTACPDLGMQRFFRCRVATAGGGQGRGEDSPAFSVKFLLFPITMKPIVTLF